ncbi:MAG: hypothetical protein LBR76_01695 [Oscillospiraceae bacterium]|jgi:hypothetical protein|nr:hypothetical protein [Oscillospiraceae bacterium]
MQETAAATTAGSVENQTEQQNERENEQNSGRQTEQQAGRQSEQPPGATAQENIGNIVAKESRKAVEKLLRDAGILPGDNPEMRLTEYKKWLDAQKGELEAARCAASDAEHERDDARTELETLKRKFAAMALGVPAEKTGDYLALANARMTGGATFEQALDAAVADYPPGRGQTLPLTAATGSLPLMGGVPGGEPIQNRHRITK